MLLSHSFPRFAAGPGRGPHPSGLRFCPLDRWPGKCAPLHHLGASWTCRPTPTWCCPRPADPEFPGWACNQDFNEPSKDVQVEGGLGGQRELLAVSCHPAPSHFGMKKPTRCRIPATHMPPPPPPPWSLCPTTAERALLTLIRGVFTLPFPQPPGQGGLGHHRHVPPPSCVRSENDSLLPAAISLS